jgi:hypothetical protein
MLRERFRGVFSRRLRQPCSEPSSQENGRRQSKEFRVIPLTIVRVIGCFVWARLALGGRS